MAASRSPVAVWGGPGSPIYAGSFAVLALPGTVTMGGAPGGGGTNPYFLLQGGIIANGGATAQIYALLNGSAVAAGTVAIIGVPANDSSPFQLTIGAQEYRGLKIDQAGGLWIKALSNGQGTPFATLYFRDVLQ